MPGDMFLEIVTKKGGKVKGESVSASCPDQIEVTKWEVTLRSPTDTEGDAVGRIQLEHVQFDFPTSIASTPLFQTLCTNDTIKTATLTVRKSGTGSTGKESKFLQWRFYSARLVSFKMVGEGDNSTDSITIAYEGVEISYRRQKGDGSLEASQAAGYNSNKNAMVKSTLGS